jgi:hypothetical protein
VPIKHYDESPFCPNCKCNGCVIHRERFKAQERINRDAQSVYSGSLIRDDDLQGMMQNDRPGQVCSYDPFSNSTKVIDEKPDTMGAETDAQLGDSVDKKFHLNDWIPWRFLLWCGVIAIGMQFVARMCGRVV